MHPVILDTVLAGVPVLALAAVTWRVTWPKWKLVVKLLLHPGIYALLTVYIGHWSVLVAWIHQGVLGLGGHIWFCRKHGFTWYAVENPARYIQLSKESVTRLGTGSRAPP